MDLQTFYQEIMQLEQRRAYSQEQMELRLSKRIDDAVKPLAAIPERVDNHRRELDDHKASIENLERSDRRWAGASAIAAVIGGVISSWVFGSGSK